MMQHKIRIALVAIVFYVAAAARGEEPRRCLEQAPEQECASEPEPLRLGAGTRVRIELSGRSDRIVGNLVEVDDQSVTLMSQANAEIGIPRNSIAKLEIHDGKRRNALFGLIIGTGAGAIIGALEEPGCDGEDCYTRAENISSGALGAGVIGMIVGAFIQTDRWIEVPGEHLSISVMTAGGGAEVSVTLSF